METILSSRAATPARRDLLYKHRRSSATILRSSKSLASSSSCSNNSASAAQQVLSCYGELLEDETFHDTFFDTADGHVIGAHKNVLSSRSKYFRSMFTCGLKESTEEHTTIKTEESKAAVYAFLRFVYTGSHDLSSLSSFELMEAYDIAHRCEVEDFQRVIQKQLLDDLMGELADVAAVLVWASGRSYCDVASMAAETLIDQRLVIRKNQSIRRHVLDTLGESKAGMLYVVKLLFDEH